MGATPEINAAGAFGGVGIESIESPLLDGTLHPLTGSASISHHQQTDLSRGCRSGGSGGSVLAEETDPHRLQQRQKQVDYGKNTLGYDRYLQLVPK